MNLKRKQQLYSLIKLETDLQKRLKREKSLAQIEQTLIIINRRVTELEQKRTSFNLNENYEADLNTLNFIKSELNSFSTKVGQLELRRDLIIESKNELDKEIANINVEQIESLYKEANLLVPRIQKSFEETLRFHNDMLKEKKEFILKELPQIEDSLGSLKRDISKLISTRERTKSKFEKSWCFRRVRINCIGAQ